MAKRRKSKVQAPAKAVRVQTPAKAVVMQPQFRSRKEPNGKGYQRHNKHKGRGNPASCILVC